MKSFDSFLEAVNAAEFSYYKGEQELMEVCDAGKRHIAFNTVVEGKGRMDGFRIVSVNLHLNCPINEALGDSYESCKGIIDEYDSCRGEDPEKWGSYDYFFEMIPVCHMADILGSLKEEKSHDSEQPLEKMLSTALLSGCTIMDMSDLSTYSL